MIQKTLLQQQIFDFEAIFKTQLTSENSKS